MKDQATSEDVTKSIDVMLARMRGLKRKLTACAEEEDRLKRVSETRIQHLAELDTMHTLDDVAYEAWSRTRLDRLLVDYLLRNGFQESAEALADAKGIRDLVDLELFDHMHRIRKSLLDGSLIEALAWCSENKKDLKRMEVGGLS